MVGGVKFMIPWACIFGRCTKDSSRFKVNGGQLRGILTCRFTGFRDLGLIGFRDWGIQRFRIQG